MMKTLSQADLQEKIRKAIENKERLEKELERLAAIKKANASPTKKKAPIPFFERLPDSPKVIAPFQRPPSPPRVLRSPKKLKLVAQEIENSENPSEETKSNIFSQDDDDDEEQPELFSRSIEEEQNSFLSEVIDSHSNSFKVNSNYKYPNELNEHEISEKLDNSLNYSREEQNNNLKGVSIDENQEYGEHVEVEIETSHNKGILWRCSIVFFFTSNLLYFQAKNFTLKFHQCQLKLNGIYLMMNLHHPYHNQSFYHHRKHNKIS